MTGVDSSSLSSSSLCSSKLYSGSETISQYSPPIVTTSSTAGCVSIISASSAFCSSGNTGHGSGKMIPFSLSSNGETISCFSSLRSSIESSISSALLVSSSTSLTGSTTGSVSS
ncbi:MAG: hypothetical protein MR497_02000 [Bacilli bacterium]|nr:hypothetical protein [Bacilli bacterium]